VKDLNGQLFVFHARGTGTKRSATSSRGVSSSVIAAMRRLREPHRRHDERQIKATIVDLANRTC
jgi:hypothetical protein